MATVSQPMFPDRLLASFKIQTESLLVGKLRSHSYKMVNLWGPIAGSNFGGMHAGDAVVVCVK